MCKYRIICVQVLAIVCLALLTQNCIAQEGDLAFQYDRIETVNGSGEYFKYDFDVKPQEGSQSVFIIQANIEQLIDLDNEWKADVTVYKSDTKDGEYTKYMPFPKVGLCSFMQTVYKKYFYDTIKDFSNMPHYDKCPLTKEKYWIKDYPFDANNFKKLAKIGYYRIEAFLLNDGIAKTGIFIYGSVTAAQ